MRKSENILLIGGGGHCISILDTLLKLNHYNKISIIDKTMMIGTCLMGVPCIGDDDQLERLFEEEYQNAFISMGSIGNPQKRKRIYHQLNQIGFNIPNIIDTTTIIGREVILGKGIFAGKNVIINGCSKIGNGVILNTAGIIEHECEVGDFTHIAPGAVLCGKVIIGSESHIGANAAIKQNLKIGSNVIVGMGSVVLKNIQDNKTVYGNPASEVMFERKNFQTID